ncbi:MAG TPA: hypothetical protein VJ180_11290, partial [Pyrinomonadaceae bacterium]|nr:hypothetical protein [Pyrinomonadaceae bacterium]
IGTGAPANKADSDTTSAPKLLYECHPLQLLPELAAEIGVKEALFLQQLFYWSEWKRTRGLDVIDGRVWVWNNHQQWCQDMPFLSRRTVGRIVDRLVKLRLVDVLQPNRSRGDCTYWYSINETKFERLRDKLEQKAAKRKEEREKKRYGINGKPSMTLPPQWQQG